MGHVATTNTFDDWFADLDDEEQAEAMAKSFDALVRPMESRPVGAFVPSPTDSQGCRTFFMRRRKSVSDRRLLDWSARVLRSPNCGRDDGFAPREAGRPVHRQNLPIDQT